MKNKSKWIERGVLIFYLVGYLLFSMTLARNQPHIDHVSVQELSPPDEASRFLVPKYICEHGTLPTGFEEEVRIAPYGFSYALYNVFPYIVQGYAMRLVSHFTDSFDALLLTGRMINVIFGFLMSIVVYLIGKKVFKDTCERWLFCFAVTYLPQALFIHSYINTDSCAMLSTAIILYGLFSAYKSDFTIKNCLWVAIGVILCSLSYYNAYGYIFCSILLFFGFYAVRENGKFHFQWKKMLPKLGLIAGVVFLGAGWWFIRSFFLLDGDILGLSTLTKMKDLYGDPSIASQATYRARGISLFQMMKENSFFTCAFQSFIAVFGSLCILPYGFVYQFYKLFFAAGFFGWILFLVLKKEPRHLEARRMFFHGNLVLCMVIPLILLIRYAYTMDYQAQGRYLLPALIPLMYYVVKGLSHAGTLSIKGKSVPAWVKRTVCIACIVVIIASCYTTVLIKALPLYKSLM